MVNKMTENELEAPEAAKFLGVRKATLYWYTSKGLLVPDKKIGKSLIFYRSTLARFKRPKIGWPKGKKRGKKN